MSPTSCALKSSPIQTISPQHILLHPKLRNRSFTESRPSLKRQATAPLLSRPEKIVKLATNDKRDTNTVDYSKDIHTAFLEALTLHPPTTTWKSKHSFTNTVDDEYYRIIQDFILKKTGVPHSFDEISERLSSAFSCISIANTDNIPPLNVQHEDPCSLSPEGRNLTYRSSNMPRIDEYPPSSMDSNSTHSTTRTDKRAFYSKKYMSMSRRRQACNRPALKLIIDMPPALSSSYKPGASCSNKTTSSVISPYLSPSAPFHLVTTPVSYPSTPVERNCEAPLEPPQITRSNSVNHRKGDRWMPTPTEGVLPSMKLSPVLLSPVVTTSPQVSKTNHGKVDCDESANYVSARPYHLVRSNSWLSSSQSFCSNRGELEALASPIAIGKNVLDSFTSFPTE